MWHHPCFWGEIEGKSGGRLYNQVIANDYGSIAIILYNALPLFFYVIVGALFSFSPRVFLPGVPFWGKTGGRRQGFTGR